MFERIQSMISKLAEKTQLPKNVLNVLDLYFKPKAIE